MTLTSVLGDAGEKIVIKYIMYVYVTPKKIKVIFRYSYYDFTRNPFSYGLPLRDFYIFICGKRIKFNFS